MAESSIEWTELTWNPVTGCKKISPGCKFCYAEVMSRRLKAMGQEKYKDAFKLRVHENELNRPYTWTKPQIVFVNSMSDLFNEDVPLEFIKKVFKVMNENPQHTFQVLTKRAERLSQVHMELTWTTNIWRQHWLGRAITPSSACGPATQRRANGRRKPQCPQKPALPLQLQPDLPIPPPTHLPPLF